MFPQSDNLKEDHGAEKMNVATESSTSHELPLKCLKPEQLSVLEKETLQEYEAVKLQKLNLDMTRGKPCSTQLDLANELDGILAGNYKAPDGTDVRNYGILDGLPATKKLFAPMLGVRENEIIVGGNSSLELMYRYLLSAHYYGLAGPESAWAKEKGQIKFLCPVPGYDRHFTVCEDLGIEMICVPFTEQGPDMDLVEKLVKSDPLIKGMWCVAKHSNPTGHTYSDDVVVRIAGLAKISGKNFRVMWDNAYEVHDLYDDAKPLKPIFEEARRQGTEDSIVIFGSTSKITFAGAGLALFGSSESNVKGFLKRLFVSTIGPDKVNQLRHFKLLKSPENMLQLMKRHAQIIRPKFETVLSELEAGLNGLEIASWTSPRGGYFISLDTMPNLAKTVVKLAADVGVKLTPAGATYPYGKDPDDCNIRLAPSFPSSEELKVATRVLVTCIKLASVQQLLAE